MIKKKDNELIITDLLNTAKRFDTADKVEMCHYMQDSGIDVLKLEAERLSNHFNKIDS